MANFKAVNVQTSAVVEFDSKKEVAEFIATQSVTDNSVKTIEKKISKAIASGDNLYETFKIEEIKNEEEVVMNNEIKNEEVVTAENTEEVVYDNPTDLDQGELENLQTAIAETAEPGDVPQFKSDLHSDESVVEEIESEEAVAEVEAENKEFAETIKEEVKEEPKENKRRVGKRLIAYKNGEEFESFPSIKAAATFFKDLMGLGHMPFTPIMKSVRQEIDWNEYSFKFEDPADLHIPESMKKATEKKTETPTAETKPSEETPSEEVVEEIEEVIEETN